MESDRITTEKPTSRSDPLRKGAKKLLHLVDHLRFIRAVDVMVCVRNANHVAVGTPRAKVSACAEQPATENLSNTRKEPSACFPAD